MSLTNALNDILEDVKSTTSLEEFTVRSVDTKSTPEVPPITTTLSQRTLEKFNIVCQKLFLKDQLQNTTKADMVIAHEVFATIPEESYVNSNKAKLTSTPSVMNKTILTEMLEGTNEEISGEIYSYMAGVSSTIKGLVDTTDVPTIRELAETIRGQVTTLTEIPSIVIYNKTSYNLFTTSMVDVCYIDDSDIEYQPYSGVLVNLYQFIIKDSAYLTFIEGKSEATYTVTLKDVLTLVSISLDQLVEYVGHLEAIDKDIVDFLSPTDKSVTTHQSLINSVAKTMDEYTKKTELLAVLKEPGNFVDKLVELAKFISR